MFNRGTFLPYGTYRNILWCTLFWWLCKVPTTAFDRYDSEIERKL